MTPDTQVSFAFICSVIAAVGVIYNIVKTNKKDNREEMSGIMKANLQLDQLCSTWNEARLDIRELKDTINEIRKTQIEHEMRIRNLEAKDDE